jgi:hypothetical protein
MAVAAAKAASAFNKLCSPTTLRFNSPTFLPVTVIVARDEFGARLI